MRALVVLIAAAWPLVHATTYAQAPAVPASNAPAASQGAANSAAATPSPAPARSALEPQGYTYDAGRRRDPFVSLVRRGAESPGATPGQRPSGLPGLSAAEISLRGTLRSHDGFVAMVHGADSKTYLVRTGDRLLDGTIRTITADALVIRRRVNDPLSPDAEYDERKVLRQTEEAR